MTTDAGKAETLPHPRELASRRLPDGRFKPLSVDEQWLQMQRWRHLLDEGGKDGDAGLFPGSTDRFRGAWRNLQEFYEKVGVSEPAKIPSDPLGKPINAPLMAFFGYIAHGLYPPPELLLTLLDCFNSGNGEDLEVTFFGKRMQRAGNYANREGARIRKEIRKRSFDYLVRKGLEPKKAAEVVSEEFGGKPEPESILREMRSRRAAEK